MIVINTANPLEDKVSDPLAPYQSQAHKDIAQSLNSYNIPFVYKQPMLVVENGKRMIEYADFFLPTYNGLAIDYIIESNSAIFQRKKNIYQDNQIPAVLVGRRDLNKPNWASRLYGTLQQIYHRNPAYRAPRKYG